MSRMKSKSFFALLLVFSLSAALAAFAQDVPKKKKTKKPARTEQKAAAAKKKPSEDEAAEKKPPAKGTDFRKWTYKITQDGAPLGVETFEHSFKNGVYTASAEIDLVPMRTVFRQRYTTGGRDFSLAKYDLAVDAMGSVVKFSAAADGGDVVVKQARDGGKAVRKVLENAAPVILLDNNCANNYQCLVNSYAQKKGGRQLFTCLVPQAASTIEVEVERTGFIKGKFWDADAEYIGYSGRETSRGLEIRIVTFSDGSLASVEFPQKKFRFAVEGVAAGAPEPEKLEGTREINLNGKHAFESGVFMDAGKGVKLFGKVIVPVIGDPRYKMPAALIIAGSGPTDRDGNSKLLPGPVNNLRELAEFLATKNIVTLRYDKRGAGASTAAADPLFGDYVDDAKNALGYLRNVPGIDPKRVFVIGHSEGGLIALKMAAEKDRLRGAVLMAAPFEPFGAILSGQAQGMAERAAGVPDAEKKKFLSEISSALKAIRAGKAYKYSAKLKFPGADVIFGALENNQRFVAEISTVEPEKLAALVKIPVLLLYAEMDMQMKSFYMDGFYGIISKNSPGKCEKLMVKGVNHVFKPAAGPNDAASYTDTTTRVSPAALSAVADFVNSK